MTNTGVFPGLPWSPSSEDTFPAYRVAPEGLENHLLVDPSADNISRAHAYSFQIKVFASADNINWTEITSSAFQVGPILYNSIAEHVYGWSFQISGMNYNSAILSPGCYIRLSKSTTTVSEVSYSESWMSGRILPGPIQFSFQGSVWTVQVVDEISYLARKKAPVFSVGAQTVTLNAVADSSTDASAIPLEGEFTGSPPLTPDQATDGNLNTLWVSTLSPSYVQIGSRFPYEDGREMTPITLNEIYSKGYAPVGSGNLDQWFELVSPLPDSRNFRMLTQKWRDTGKQYYI